jgi:hypothetical protein
VKGLGRFHGVFSLGGVNPATDGYDDDCNVHGLPAANRFDQFNSRNPGWFRPIHKNLGNTFCLFHCLGRPVA